MLTKIKKAIADTLKDELSLQVDLEERAEADKAYVPYCYVTTISSSETMAIKGRYKRESKCLLRYYPHTQSKNQVMDDLGDKLFYLLSYIEVESNLVRAKDMSYTIKEGVLHMELTYVMHLSKTPKPSQESSAPMMKGLTASVGKMEE